MRDSGPAALATWSAAVKPCHLGAGTGLIDEDQLGWIEVQLTLNPVFASCRYVGTLLLGSMRCLFLSVIWRRSKNRQSVPMPKLSPRACNRTRNSFSVISGLASTAARM